MKGTIDQNADFSRYRRLVENIAAGDIQAEQELYAIFAQGVRDSLTRKLPLVQDVEDELHNVFMIVLNAIRGGEIREPERLVGFVRTVVRRIAQEKIGEIERIAQETIGEIERNNAAQSYVTTRQTPPNQENTIANQERTKAVKRVLNGMAARDREILMRFYLKEQTPEEICGALGVTVPQFRLVKSRARQAMEAALSDVTTRQTPPKQENTIPNQE